MSNSELKALKSQGKQLKAILTIGRQGFGENSLENIKKNLAANKLCKIKISREYIASVEQDKKEVAEDIAKQLGAQLIDLVGFVAVFYKR